MSIQQYTPGLEYGAAVMLPSAEGAYVTHADHLAEVEKQSNEAYDLGHDHALKTVEEIFGVKKATPK